MSSCDHFDAHQLHANWTTVYEIGLRGNVQKSGHRLTRDDVREESAQPSSAYMRWPIWYVDFVLYVDGSELAQSFLCIEDSHKSKD